MLFNNATSYTVSLPPSVTVTGVTVTVNGVTGFAAGNVSFTAHSVTLDVTGSVWHGSDSVVVALQQSCGPACGLSNAQASLNVASAIGLGGSATASVHDGSVEFDPAPGDQRFSVDVEETSIRMFNNTGTTNVLFNNATSYTVSIPAAAGVSIVGVSTVVNGVSGFTAGNVSFTASSVTLAVTGSVWHGSDSVVVSLQTVCQ